MSTAGKVYHLGFHREEQTICEIAGGEDGPSVFAHLEYLTAQLRQRPTNMTLCPACRITYWETVADRLEEQ